MNKALEYAKRIAYSSEETLMFTYEMAKKYADSPGCYLEAGVAAGAQIIAMKAGAPDKDIHAFDSFQGIPHPSNRDDQMPGIRMLTKDEQNNLPNPGEVILKSTGATSVPVHDFMDHVIMSGVRQHGIVIHKGWFEETIPAWRGEPISILRLDGDLYNSTHVCLKHLYPKVMTGGLLIIDDWQLQGCRDAVYDYFTSIKYVHPFPFFKFISNIAYWIKP